MRGHHVDIHSAPRVADLRAQLAAQVPDGFVALNHRALAAVLRRDPRTARRYLERFAATQRDPEVLRVVRLPVVTGKGAVRLALHVLWPVVDAA